MNICKETYKKCDDLYFEYLHSLKENAQDRRLKYHNLHQVSRNKLNAAVSRIIESKDDRTLWKNINWSGKYEYKYKHKIPVQFMSDSFEKLYEPLTTTKNKKNEMIFTYSKKETMIIQLM